MDVRGLYESLGVNFDDVLALLRKEERIKLYLVQTMDDPSFADLSAAMASGDYEVAFRAAHTIKGMAANLMLKPLLDNAVPLVECLRGGQPDPAEALRLYEALEANRCEVAQLVKALA